MSNDDQKAMFIQLIIMLGSSAMQNLGKIVNPVTQKTEVNLEAAQASIDILDMLEAKTKGNLDNDESRFLKATTADLKLNYVETASAAPPPAAAPPAGEEKIDNKRFSKKFE